jgi:hypothetical protein
VIASQPTGEKKMSDGPDAPFDPKAAVRALVATQPNRPERKLSFHDQCAAFYALYNGMSAGLVAKTFGVTIGTASQLGGCLPKDPRPYEYETKPLKQRFAVKEFGGIGGTGKTVGYQTLTVGEQEVRVNRDMNRGRSPNRIQRYRRVGEEFMRLGEDAFAQTYYTDAVHRRLMEVKHGLDEGRGRRGPDPTPDQYAGIFDTPDGPLTIEWISPHGWRWVNNNHPSDGFFRKPRLAYQNFWEWAALPYEPPTRTLDKD